MHEQLLAVFMIMANQKFLVFDQLTKIWSDNVFVHCQWESQ